MLKKVQRLGGALFAPVLLFAFSGILVSITIILKNPDFVGELANPDGTFYKVIYIIEEGAWTVFRQLPLLFVIGLPISLATKAQARASMTALVSFLVFNYFVKGILTFWGNDFGIDFNQQINSMNGITTIAGIKTLDTSMIGAIIVSGISIIIHNKFFDKKLPDFLGIFQGSTLVFAISFFSMLPLAFITCLVWPKVQLGIISLQSFLVASGAFGVWLYTFLERILIPTGLHHFIAGPFVYGPAIVDGGIAKFWAENINYFSSIKEPLAPLFPQGGFALHGNGKIFGAIGIALALYKVAKKENKKVIAGLLIPAALTAILAGVTEPFEFTFMFIAPILFFIHAVLSATMATLMFTLGVVGNMSGGLIEIMTINWLPLLKNHYIIILTQIFIGLGFVLIYYFIFKIIIEKFDIKTPGREDDNNDIKLYTKEDLKKCPKQEKKSVQNQYMTKAIKFVEAFGGPDNIETVSSCATRLRISVNDEEKVLNDSLFRSAGAAGVVRNGKAFQVIVGLSVPQIRECFEEIINNK
ncbi:MAG: alpha-glucoside-specific PTS transporter subunit IIBC [Cetobacterium sp.]